MPYAVRKGKFVTRAVPSVSSGLFVIFLVARPAICDKGKILGMHRVWSERPRVTGRYSGCYVRTTVSGDSSDNALASDAHLHTCFAGTRGVIILLHSHQDGANVRASQPTILSCCRLPPRLEEASWGTGPLLASCRTSTSGHDRPVESNSKFQWLKRFASCTGWYPCRRAVRHRRPRGMNRVRIS